jgi:hypothetical protein
MVGPQPPLCVCGDQLKPPSLSEEDLWVAHFAQQMTLHIQLQEAQGQGRITTPYLEIIYKAVTYQEADTEPFVSVRVEDP